MVDISSAQAARTSVYPKLDRVVPRRGLRAHGDRAGTAGAIAVKRRPGAV